MARKLADHLDAGEHPVVALLVEPKGTYGLGMFALAAAPRFSGRKLSRRAADEHGAGDGLAAGFPSEPAVVMVTQQRVLAAASNGWKVSAPSFEVPLGSVKVGSIRRKGMGRRMQLVFADGSAVTVDAQNLQPFDLFRETLGTAP